MTQRDWKKELETIGGAIGKAYKTRSGEKFICYGDYRLTKEQAVYPILMAGMQFIHSYSPNGNMLTEESEHDIVDAWTDEPVKVKIERVKLFVTYPKVNYIFESNWYRNEKDFTKDLNTDYVIISREYKEFDEILTYENRSNK